MKKHLLRKSIVAVCATLFLIPFSLLAQKSVAPRHFHAALAPYGHWLIIENGIEVWKPVFVPIHWQPYIEGRWVWTHWGWYWVSDEPFGWIVYHYGRWYYHNVYGWIWFPDNEWGPSWVTWRYNDNYIGWAPLPPATIVHISFYSSYATPALPPQKFWCFVPYDKFHRRTHHHYLPSPVADDIYAHSVTFGNNHEKQPFTPEFIERRSGTRVPRSDDFSERTFGSQRSNAARSEWNNSDPREQQDERTNDFAQNQQKRMQQQSSRDNSKATRQEQPATKPKVTPFERAPREMREELLQRYERNRTTPPPANRRSDERGNSHHEQREEVQKRRR